MTSAYHAYGPIGTSASTGASIFLQDANAAHAETCPGGHVVGADPDLARFIDGRIVVFCENCDVMIHMEEMPSGGLLARVHEVIGVLAGSGPDEHALHALKDVVDRFGVLLDEATSIRNAIHLALEIASRDKT